jgi:hypothetical protein
VLCGISSETDPQFVQVRLFISLPYGWSGCPHLNFTGYVRGKTSILNAKAAGGGRSLDYNRGIHDAADQNLGKLARKSNLKKTTTGASNAGKSAISETTRPRSTQQENISLAAQKTDANEPEVDEPALQDSNRAIQAPASNHVPPVAIGSINPYVSFRESAELVEKNLSIWNKCKKASKGLQDTIRGKKK